MERQIIISEAEYKQLLRKAKANQYDAEFEGLKKDLQVISFVAGTAMYELQRIGGYQSIELIRKFVKEDYNYEIGIPVFTGEIGVKARKEMIIKYQRNG